MKKSKKERKTANNNEIHHICVATRHMEAQWKCWTAQDGGKGQGNVGEGGYLT
jgi:hypothetical protein